MQQILNLSNEFCSKLASDPSSLSDFVRQSVRELTSLSKLIKPLNDYGSLLTSKKLLEAASSGESSPCYSENDEEDDSLKKRNKSITLYEIGQMFLDTSSTIEITQVTQDGSWYSWIMLHGLHEEEYITGLQKLLDKHLKLKFESIKPLIYKGKKSLVIQCKDYFSAQKTFHFLDEDFYAKAYIKKRWPVIRFYNRMAEPKYMAQFCGIILKNLPSDCTVQTIANLIKMNCPSVSCLSIEIPTQIEDTIATVIRTKNLEDAEMLALTLNDLMSENTKIQAGLHPCCSLKQENSAKGPFKEIKGSCQNTTNGSELSQGQAKNNVKDLLSMFKEGQQKPLTTSNKKENKDEGTKEGYQSQRPVGLDPRERVNSSGKSLKNNQKMETEEVDREKIQQEDSSQLLYSPTQRSPRQSPARKILYDEQMENDQKPEFLNNPPPHFNNQHGPPMMHQQGPNIASFPLQNNNLAGPGILPFPLLEHQRPPMDDFHRQGNQVPEMYRRPIQENNIPNHPHFNVNARMPFQPHGNFPQQNPYMGHNVPHMEHKHGPPMREGHQQMFYDKMRNQNEIPIEMRNPNMNLYPQQPPREIMNTEPFVEPFTPEDAQMRPKYRRMIVKGPLYPTMAFKKKMMANHAMQMSDIPKYYIPEDRKNKVSKISLKKLWQPKYIPSFREMRNMKTRYMMQRLQRMAMREVPLAKRLNTITGFEGPLIFKQPNQPEKRPEQKVISTQINEWKLDINTITRPMPMPQNISIADMYSSTNRGKPNTNERVDRNIEAPKKNAPEQVIPKNIKNFSKLPYWATRPLDNRQMEENEFLQRRLIERSWQEQEKPIISNPPVQKSEPVPVQKAQKVQYEQRPEERSVEQASQENAKYIQQQLRSASDKDQSSDWKIVFNVEAPKPNPPSTLPPKKLNEKIPAVSNIDNKKKGLELNLNNRPQIKPTEPSQPMNGQQSSFFNLKKSEKIEDIEVKKQNNLTKKTESGEKTVTKDKDIIMNPIGKKPISQEKDHLNRSGFQKLKQSLLDFQRKSNSSQNYKSGYLNSQRYLDEEESETSSSDGENTIIASLAKKRAEAKQKAQKKEMSENKPNELNKQQNKEKETGKEKMIEDNSKEKIVKENNWLINYHVESGQKKAAKGTFKEDEALKSDKKGESQKASLKLPIKGDEKTRGQEIKKMNTDQASSQVAASPQAYSPQILLNQTFSSFSTYQMPQNLVMNPSVSQQRNTQEADSKPNTEPKEAKEDQPRPTNSLNEQNNTSAPIPIPNPPNQMTFTSHISHVPAVGYMYFPTVSSTVTYSSMMMNMMAPNHPQVAITSDPLGFNPQMMVYHNNMIVNPLVNGQPASYYVHPNPTYENKPNSKKTKADKGKYSNRKDLKKSMDKKPYDDINIHSGQKRTHQSLSWLNEGDTTVAEDNFSANEAKSPEMIPEPEGTPPSMPVEPSGNDLGNNGSPKKVIRDGVDCDVKNIHKSL